MCRGRGLRSCDADVPVVMKIKEDHLAVDMARAYVIGKAIWRLGRCCPGHGDPLGVPPARRTLRSCVWGQTVWR